jgi:propanol-preferring alcohol dehydrogenase
MWIQAYVDFLKSKNLVADVKAATPGGLGAHAVILLAVSEKPFQQATEYVRSRGTIIAIGLPPDAYLKAPVLNTVVRMINIKGSYVGNRQDGVEAIDFFARGLIKAPFKLAPLKDLPKIFELMGTSPFIQDNRYGTDEKNRARQDCRPLCARAAGVGE